MTQNQDHAEIVDLISGLFLKVLNASVAEAMERDAMIMLVEKFSDLLASEANKGQAVRALHYWTEQAPDFVDNWQKSQASRESQIRFGFQRSRQIVLTAESLSDRISACGPPPNWYKYESE